MHTLHWIMLAIPLAVGCESVDADKPDTAADADTDTDTDTDTWRSNEEIRAAVAALPLDFAGGSTLGGRTPWFTDDVLTPD